MCTLEVDDYAKIWNEAPRVARKEHECDACHALIPKGVAYLHHSSLYDGHWTTEAMCFPCWWVREAFALEHRYTPVPNQLVATLRECIDGRLSAGERSAPTNWAPELASVLRRYRTSEANREHLAWLWMRRALKREGMLTRRILAQRAQLSSAPADNYGKEDL